MLKLENIQELKTLSKNVYTKVVYIHNNYDNNYYIILMASNVCMDVCFILFVSSYEILKASKELANSKSQYGRNFKY